MEKHIIKLPSNFAHNNFDDFLRQRKDLLLKKPSTLFEIHFDSSETESFSLLGVLLLAQTAYFFVQNNCKCYVDYGKEKDASGVKWVMKTMGLLQDDRVGDIKKYLDKIRVKVQRCNNGTESLKAVNMLMPIIKEELKPSESILKTLNWALWELVDNAGIHGYGVYKDFSSNWPQPVYFCAFSHKEFIDIAILDTGQGVHKSFLSSGQAKYKSISNDEALALAIKNTESGHPKGSPGFGLFGCSEIAKQSNGRLVLLSGQSKLIQSQNAVEISAVENFDGTMVLLRVPRNLDFDLKKIFGENSAIISESLDDLIGGI